MPLGWRPEPFENRPVRRLHWANRRLHPIVAFGLLLSIDPSVAQRNFSGFLIGHRTQLGALLRQSKPYARAAAMVFLEPGGPIPWGLEQACRRQCAAHRITPR